MKKYWFFVLAVIAALLLSPLVSSAAPAGAAPDRDERHAADWVLVKFQPGTDRIKEGEIHRKHGGEVLDVIPGIDVQVVKITSGRAREKADEYARDREVRFAEPDFVAQATLTPNDQYFGNQWGMVKIQAPQAWDLTAGAGVKIAILDTGIDQDHEDLQAKIIANKNFTRSKTADDKYGHGTHVAGIAAGITNNGKGVAGVGYGASLMNVKVLGDTGSGNYSWIASGIIWAADNGARVINMSLGGSSGSSTLEDAVNYAWSKGVVVVAAAGNSNTSSPSYPGYYANAIAVAATDQNDVKASFSNYGDWVDVAAPGVSSYSTLPNHRNSIGPRNYGYLSGTSMASPHVAGEAALVFASHPTWTNADVRARIQAATDPTSGFTTALGRVNAYQAVQP